MLLAYIYQHCTEKEDEQQLLAIMGEAGAGKTYCLQTIVNLLRHLK